MLAFAAIHSLGNLYVDQGKLDEAETYQRALEGTEKAIGSDHSSTFDTVNNLGFDHQRCHRLRVSLATLGDNVEIT
jgi:hypothetical protein